MDRRAWRVSVHGSQRVGHDLVAVHFSCIVSFNLKNPLDCRYCFLLVLQEKQET